MPLREDLLEPISGENPSGADLWYDKIFDQIKEAKSEEEDVMPAGVWSRAQKKADHVTVIKLASETLAKRTKDLRLATWLVESHFRREGFELLIPGLELLKKIQDEFWSTFYPVIEEDGDMGSRVGAMETYSARMYLALRSAPVTKSGFNILQCRESRTVGYEADAETSEKMAVRNEAIERGKVTAEDFDKAFLSTPKQFYSSVEDILARALSLLDDVDQFQQEKYGDDYPNLAKFRSALEEEKLLFTALLNKKRETEPDEIAQPDFVEEPVEVPVDATSGSSSAPAAAQKATRARGSLGAPESADEAYALIVTGAEYLRAADTSSPVPYLLCVGLRLGETRRQGSSPAFDFAVAPSTETRQTFRRIANEGNWDELLRLSLQALSDKSARAWLDLQRYIWRAARGAGYDAIAVSVVATVRALLQDIPELRRWTLDDDTPAANLETQQWIDAEVLPPAAVVVETATVSATETTDVTDIPAQHVDVEEASPAIYDTALELLKSGKAREAISMLVRDSELQPSGRMRFLRRVQVAQLCLTANQDAIAYPVLMDISNEIERRGLETWESGAMLAYPLSLLLRCLDRRKNSADDREVIFARLCRLDPQAAITSGR
jgi:type VI secretion system protein ImpA